MSKSLTRTSKLSQKLKCVRPVVYQNSYTKKRCQAESTDESGGLSFKSRNKNIGEESFSGFKLIQNFLTFQ